MIYYSQHGEDCLLRHFFKDADAGFYIDVGAFDGKHLSNTYLFDLDKWNGICVEPEVKYFQLCKNARTAVCVNAACVSDPSIQVVEFMTLDQGGLGSQAKEIFLKSKHKKRFTFSSTSVPAITLNQLLEDCPTYKGTIDLLSVDVEGAEIDVLQGLDFAKHFVRVIVAEANTDQAKEKLDHYLIQEHGYHYAGAINVNKFYVKEEDDVAALRSIDVECYLKNNHPTIKNAGTNKDLKVRSKLNEIS